MLVTGCNPPSSFNTLVAAVKVRLVMCDRHWRDISDRDIDVANLHRVIRIIVYMCFCMCVKKAMIESKKEEGKISRCTKPLDVVIVSSTRCSELRNMLLAITFDICIWSTMIWSWCKRSWNQKDQCNVCNMRFSLSSYIGSHNPGTIRKIRTEELIPFLGICAHAPNNTLFSFPFKISLGLFPSQQWQSFLSATCFFI